MGSALLVAAIMPAAKVLAETSGGTIPGLLTGGGFVLLAAVVAGLFLIGKNKADATGAIATGAATSVTTMQHVVETIKAEHVEDREEWEAEKAELIGELRALKEWARAQAKAHAAHAKWDVRTIETVKQLVEQCEAHGVCEPGSVTLEPPPSLEVPLPDDIADDQ